MKFPNWKKKVDANETKENTKETYDIPPDQEETGTFLQDNIDSV